MRAVYKVRVYPDPEQADLLVRTFECARPRVEPNALTSTEDNRTDRRHRTTTGADGFEAGNPHREVTARAARS